MKNFKSFNEGSNPVISEIDNLVVQIDTLIKNKGIQNFNIESDSFDISIQFKFNKSENIYQMNKVIGISKYLSDELLSDVYDCEIDFYTDRKLGTVLSVNFYYEEDKKNRKPF